MKGPRRILCPVPCTRLPMSFKLDSKILWFLHVGMIPEREGCPSSGICHPKESYVPPSSVIPHICQAVCLPLLDSSKFASRSLNPPAVSFQQFRSFVSWILFTENNTVFANQAFQLEEVHFRL